MRTELIILPLCALFACAPAATPATPEASRWAADLEASPEFAEVTASATAVRTVGATTVQLELSGSEPVARHPWHVHRGACGSGGGIVGDPGRYPPLQVGADGRGLTTAVVDAELEAGEAYHVNVHRSPGAMATIIACGELVEVAPR